MTNQFQQAKKKLNEIQEIADKKLSGNYTSQILFWEDGDFSIEVYHGFTKNNGKQMKEVLRYKHSAGQIILEEQHKADWGRATAEIVNGQCCIDCGSEKANVVDIYGLKCNDCYNKRLKND